MCVCVHMCVCVCVSVCACVCVCVCVCVCDVLCVSVCSELHQPTTVQMVDCIRLKASDCGDVIADRKCKLTTRRVTLTTTQSPE